MNSTFAADAANALQGRKIDIVAFVDRLLNLAAQCKYVAGRLKGQSTFEVELGPDSFSIPVDGAEGKVRAMCANFAVRTGETTEHSAGLYGGKGQIMHNGLLHSVSLMNRAGDAWFRVELIEKDGCQQPAP